MFQILLAFGKNKEVDNYAVFLAKTSSFVVKPANASFGRNSGYAKIIPNNLTNSMWGSSYGTNFTYDSYLNSVACHAFPDQSLLAHSIDTGKYCALKIAYLGRLTAYSSVSRNGYTSKAYGAFDGCALVDFIYYDNITKKMMRYNPNGLTTPVVWDNTFI